MARTVQKFNRLITNDEDEMRFILKVVNKARYLPPPHLTRESVIDVVLAQSLQFLVLRLYLTLNS